MSRWLWGRNLIGVSPWVRTARSASFDCSDASFKQCVMCLEGIDFLHHREAVALEASEIVIETLVS